MSILATDIDPTPWGAWVALIVGVLVLLGIIVGAIAWFWKKVAMPDVRDAIRADNDRRDAKHAAQHDDLGRRINDLDKATDASFRYVHGRIDDVIIGRTPRPSA